jgi:hypothetical protein
VSIPEAITHEQKYFAAILGELRLLNMTVEKLGAGLRDLTQEGASAVGQVPGKRRRPPKECEKKEAETDACTG